MYDMPHHKERATLHYSADELFAVVADVKDYPAFVPWGGGAHLRREDEREIIAELVNGVGPFRESFTSQVTLDRTPQAPVQALDGPLEHPAKNWTLTPIR